MSNVRKNSSSTKKMDNQSVSSKNSSKPSISKAKETQLKMNKSEQKINYNIKDERIVKNERDLIKETETKLNNYLTKSKPVFNESNSNPTQKMINSYQYEYYLVKIQKWWRRILKIKSNDPLHEMKVLLKKKKMNILKNYNLVNENKSDDIDNLFNDKSRLRKNTPNEDDFMNNFSNQNEINLVDPLKSKNNCIESIFDDLKKSNIKIDKIKEGFSNKNKEKSFKENDAKIEKTEQSLNDSKFSRFLKEKDRGQTANLNDNNILKTSIIEDILNGSKYKGNQNIDDLNDDFFSKSNVDIDNNKTVNEEKSVNKLKNQSRKHTNPLYEKDIEISKILTSKENLIPENDTSQTSNQIINNLKQKKTNQSNLDRNEINDSKLTSDKNFQTSNQEKIGINSIKDKKPEKNEQKSEIIQINQKIITDKKDYNDTSNFDLDIQNLRNQINLKDFETKIVDNSINSNQDTLKSGKNFDQELIKIKVELKESKKTIETMKIVMDELKKQSKIKEETIKTDLGEKLTIQKYEYEKIIQYKTNENETITNENLKLKSELKILNEKLSELDNASNKKLNTILENQELEKKRERENWFETEKIRRKKWEEKKINEIKEATIKGLEPEIEKILQSHKQELFEIEEYHMNEIKKLKESISSDYERKLNEIKEKMNKEKEDSLEKERYLLGNRFKHQSERYEIENEEERKRWTLKLNSEIQRLEILREKDRKSFEEDSRKLEERLRKNLEDKDNYYQTKINELENRWKEKYRNDVEDMKIKLEKEKSIFIDEKTKEFEQRTTSMKHELMKDKDRQLELIVNKLGDETINEKRKIQAECELKADQINKNLRSENEHFKIKLQELNEKLNAEAKARIILDENIDSLSKRKNLLEQEIMMKDNKISELSNSKEEMNTRFNILTKDYEKLKFNSDIEIQSKIEKYINENKALNEKIEQVKNFYEGRINEIKNSYDYQINIIDTKVKKKLESREDIINQLQDDLHLKEITIQKYEELLEKQRKEFLLNK